MALISSLFGWLGRAKAANRRFKDIAELREYVLAALKKLPGVEKVVADANDPAKFTLTINGSSLTADLTNTYGYLAAYPEEDVDKQIDRFIRSMIESAARTFDESKFVAVIRTHAYISFFKEKGIEILSEPLGADLVITYMIDLPDSMSPITPKDVPGKDLPMIRKVALNNVSKWLPNIVKDDRLQAGVLYFVKDNTMLSTSLILLDDFWKSIEPRFPGDVLIALPRKDQLFIFKDGDPQIEAAARQLIDVTIHENFNLLSEQLYARRNGKIGLA